MSKRERADDIESILDIFDVTATINMFGLPLFDSVDSCMPEIRRSARKVPNSASGSPNPISGTYKVE